jgi:dTDP-4-dehydrorhamnose 3,5-epimerase
MSNFAAERLSIPDVVLIMARRFADSRGWFMESWKAPAFAELGVAAEFVQDNHSMSARRGTVRGLHFQSPPRAQAKLVRVLRGAIYDVAVDLRRGSPTYGQQCGATLTAAGGEQLFVPRGFAHGFCTLEDETEVAYKVDDVYAPECDGGLLWSDADIGVNWPCPAAEILVSDKDAKLPNFAGFHSPFEWKPA